MSSEDLEWKLHGPCLKACCLKAEEPGWAKVAAWERRRRVLLLWKGPLTFCHIQCRKPGAPSLLQHQVL